MGTAGAVPISDFLAEKWDRRLENWLLWFQSGGGGSSEGVSSAYSLEEFGTGNRSGYRECGNAVLTGEAMDTDALMHEIRRWEERIYHALVEWTKNDGTRGAQAARLSTSADTLKDWVDTGKRELERRARMKSKK